MSNAEIKSAAGLILDPVPDERGNLTTVAMIASGAMIALTLNAN